MLLLLAAVIALCWILGIGVFHVTSAAIHFLLVLAIAAIILHFVTGDRRSVV